MLGFDDPADYNADFNPYFGETVGRVANRIASARIDNLNGRSYTLNANNGTNTNHGGAVSWGKRLFDGPHFVRRRERDAVLFTYLSKDGEEGFPGAVELKVWYVPSVTENRSSLEIEYEVSLVDGHVEETVVNVCNHRWEFSCSSTSADTSQLLQPQWLANHRGHDCETMHKSAPSQES